MKEYFSVKKALTEMIDGNTVKMSSNDFKSHLFKIDKKNYQKPILHEVKKNIGGIIRMTMTYNDFKEKYKDNEFYIYEEN